MESLAILDFAMFLLYEICFAGVNTPDHDVLFDNIVSRVTSEVSPYVTLIKHKSTSTSSLKHIMQSFASQLNDIGSESGRCNIPELSNTMCTFSHIEKWYEAMETKPLSPKVSFMLSVLCQDLWHDIRQGNKYSTATVSDFRWYVFVIFSADTAYTAT